MYILHINNKKKNYEYNVYQYVLVGVTLITEFTNSFFFLHHQLSYHKMDDITPLEIHNIIHDRKMYLKNMILPGHLPRCFTSICSCFRHEASLTRQGLLQEFPSVPHTGFSLCPLQSILHEHLPYNKKCKCICLKKQQRVFLSYME